MPEKIRKSIVYFFLAVALFAGMAIAWLTVAMHRGIHIERFSWKSAQLEKCYIVWDNKVIISVGTINITPEEVKKVSSIDGIDAHGILQIGKFIGSFISELNVEHLRFKEFSSVLNYTGWSGETPGVIHLSSADITFDATIQPDGRDLILEINDLSINSYRSAITGSARISHDPVVKGNLLANIAGKLPLSLTIVADDKGLSYASDKPVSIDSIKPVVDLFQISPTISPWITEYLKGTSYKLTLLEGRLPWNDPASFLDNLHAKARIQNCEYTFGQGLKPVKSEHTDVEFNKRVLNIYPYNARFYGQDCEKSWLKIDFTEIIEPILTAYIDTHASVNDDIVNLFGYYDIALPIKQIEGKTAADVVLEINLSNIDLNATATFKVDRGAFMFEGMALDVSDCIVSLENSDLTIQQVLVTYPEVFTGKVNGHLALNKRYGDISVHALDARFNAGDSKITLHNGPEGLSLIYHIRPEGISVESNASTWQVNSNHFHLAKFTAPFNPRTSILSLPPTSIKTTGVHSEAIVSGDINLKTRTVDLLLDLNSFRDGSLQLAQPHWKLRVMINNGLKIVTGEASSWLLQSIDTILSPFEIEYKNDEITIQNGNLTYGDFFEGSMNGNFNFNNRKGSFFFSKLNLKNDTFGRFFSDYDGFEVIVSGDERGTELTIPLLDVTIDSGKDSGWHVTFHDLERLTGRFPFLKRYHFLDGTLSLSSINGRKPYQFSGVINYPYSVLVADGKPVNSYAFSGVIGEDNISAEVLGKLNITIDEKISITSDNIEYNIIQLVELLRNLSKATSGATRNVASKPLELMARNSSLYFRPENRVLADKLQLAIQDGKTSLWLQHDSGTAVFVAEDGEFFLEGDNLDDSFMEALLAGSNFNGGTLNFAGNGSADNFEVRFKVQNTILENYSVMNNVLAFVNTIPALITFSVPDYNTEGMMVESALLDLTYDENLYTIKSFDVNASEITIRGVGNASLAEDNIDLKLNLITEGRKDLSKIPLVGYILVGDEKVPSITLEVTGKLTDPDIKNSAFEEVVTLPFDIGLRTLMSPFKWIDNLFSDEDPVSDSKNISKDQSE